VFENRMLKGIFGPKKDEFTGGLKKLHNEELQFLLFIITTKITKPRQVKWNRHVA
jgi:hypothetical protein